MTHDQILGILMTIAVMAGTALLVLLGISVKKAE